MNCTRCGQPIENWKYRRDKAFPNEKHEDEWWHIDPKGIAKPRRHCYSLPYHENSNAVKFMAEAYATVEPDPVKDF